MKVVVVSLFMILSMTVMGYSKEEGPYSLWCPEEYRGLSTNDYTRILSRLVQVDVVTESPSNLLDAAYILRSACKLEWQEPQQELLRVLNALVGKLLNKKPLSSEGQALLQGCVISMITIFPKRSQDDVLAIWQKSSHAAEDVFYQIQNVTVNAYTDSFKKAPSVYRGSGPLFSSLMKTSRDVSIKNGFEALLLWSKLLDLDSQSECWKYVLKEFPHATWTETLSTYKWDVGIIGMAAVFNGRTKEMLSVGLLNRLADDSRSNIDRYVYLHLAACLANGQLRGKLNKEQFKNAVDLQQRIKQFYREHGEEIRSEVDPKKGVDFLQISSAKMEGLLGGIRIADLQ